MKRIALVTGANRGIGLEVSKQLARKGLKVWMGMRDPLKSADLLKAMQSENLDVQSISLDVANESSIHQACQTLGVVDVLVNNAGIFGNERGAFTAEASTILQVFQTNTLGALWLMQGLVPGMQKRGYGRVVNISSGMGQLSEMNGGYVAYRVSKVALNALTRVFSDEVDEKDVLINSCCPGWVKTDMGGPGAEREVSEGADTPVWLATLPSGGPRNGFFRDRKPIEW